uniref:SPK domain-containing protein n=1 Tax=Caenorhabditis tropicalis TaxID=1561998 RepID=A0A1I7T0A8_9PELO
MKPALYEKYPDLFDYLVEKTRHVTAPMSVSLLTKEYVKDTGSREILDTLNHRIYSFRSKLSQLDNYDTVTRVKLLFALSGPVDLQFLREIRKGAKVDIDNQRRITRYISNNNLLRLEGDHRNGAKGKVFYVERKRRSTRRKDSEDTGDESGEGNEVAVSKNGETRTASGRIVKKPRLYIDQLAASYSALTAKQTKGTVNNGRFILYDDTGDSRTALLPEELEERRKNIDMMKIIKEEENDEEVTSPAQQTFSHILKSKIDNFKSPSLLSLPLKPAPESKPLIQKHVVSHMIIPKFETSKIITQTRAAQSKTANINDFLKPLRNMIEILNSSVLSNLQKRLDRRVSEFDANDLRIPNSVIQEAFEASLRLITKHATSSISNENSTRFKEFLLIFQMTTCHFTSSDYSEFQKWLKKACHDSRRLNKRISFEKIRLGLEFGIDYVLP